MSVAYLEPSGGLTLTEPGRYIIFCGVPVGANPWLVEQQYKQFPLAQQIEGVPAHAEVGQIAEIVVTAD